MLQQATLIANQCEMFAAPKSLTLVAQVNLFDVACSIGLIGPPDS